MEIIKTIFLHPVLINTVKFILPGFLLYISLRCYIWLPTPSNLTSKEFDRLVLTLKWIASFYIGIFVFFLIITGYYFFTTEAHNSLDNFFVKILIEGYWNWNTYYNYDNYLFSVITWLFTSAIILPGLLYYLERRHRKSYLKDRIVTFNNARELKEKLKEDKKELEEYKNELAQKERKLNEDRNKLEQTIRKEVREEEILRIRKETLEEIAEKKQNRQKKREDLQQQNNIKANNNDLKLFE
ncbi:MAG: hypothetical protein ACOCV1_08060 [Bacillota bacterium]